MAKPATTAAQTHLLRALSRWPKDTIRPSMQLQDVLQKRIENNTLHLSEQDRLRQANAIYTLLENRYKRKYPITGGLLKPKSNPTYYENLVKELEEAPNRSWLGRLALRLKGLVRLQ